MLRVDAQQDHGLNIRQQGVECLHRIAVEGATESSANKGSGPIRREIRTAGQKPLKVMPVTDVEKPSLPPMCLTPKGGNTDGGGVEASTRPQASCD